MFSYVYCIIPMILLYLYYKKDIATKLQTFPCTTVYSTHAAPELALRMQTFNIKQFPDC